MSDEPDVLIVGASLVGLSTALFLRPLTLARLASIYHRPVCRA